MATVEERMQILRMIEGGQITAEEGARLLEALSEEGKERPEDEARLGGRGKGPRRVRVLVTDLETGRQKLDINLPSLLISAGTRMGARFAPTEIDLEDVMEAVQAGAEGKIIDVLDEEDGERVQIFVE